MVLLCLLDAAGHCLGLFPASRDQRIDYRPNGSRFVCSGISLSCVTKQAYEFSAAVVIILTGRTVFLGHL